MHPILRIIGIGVVFFITAMAWFVLGGVMMERTNSQQNKLRGQVSELWGTSQAQQAPTFTLEREVEVSERSITTINGEAREVERLVKRVQPEPRSAASTRIKTDLHLDQRLKGLMWYSLYDVDFHGSWRYVHQEDTPETLAIAFHFPDTEGLYDAFRFVVNGEDLASKLRPEHGMKTHLRVNPGDEVTLEVSYRSRGMGQWSYVPAQGVASLEDFELAMTTDFDEIDFPPYTMSPSEREATDAGWALKWRFDQVITGHDIGMTMPDRIQPGEMASSLSFSAPVSLAFFFLVLFVLGTLRGIDIHPINYMFLGGAFFAFHLLFSYSVDHLTVVPAFALASVVSVGLVISYLRLVVSARFAFVEATLAQLIYLVGFSLAHFWDGFTGLTVTVLSILTLFVLMQLTGRIQWSEVLRGGRRDHVQGNNAQPSRG